MSKMEYVVSLLVDELSVKLTHKNPMIIVPMHPTKYPEFTCKNSEVNEQDLKDVNVLSYKSHWHCKDSSS